MEWQTPAFVEIRMDAEISAYQDDSDPTRDPIFALPTTPPTEKQPAPER